MTITLSQLTDLQRVRIALSGWHTSVTAVRVERSLNEQLWMTVRGGVELPVDTGDGQLDDFEWFDGRENHYRVTTLDPEPGLLLTGTSGDYASTPDHNDLDITGDIDLRAEVVTDDWTPDASSGLVAKFDESGDQRSYMFRLNTDGTLGLFWSTDGTAGGQEFRNSTDAVPSSSERLALLATLDVDNGSSEHVVTFYTAPVIGGPWTQLGDPITTAGTTSVHSGSAALEVGSYHGGTAGVSDLTVVAVEVRDGIDGTVAADPVFSAEESGTASFDDTAGRTWTLQGDAELVTFETDSITPDLGGVVWLKSIRYPFLNRPIFVTNATPGISRGSRSKSFPVSARSTGSAQNDLRHAPEFTLTVLTQGPDHLTEARDMDLVLASGDTFYVHVPASRRVPGGYVIIGGDTDQDPLGAATQSPHTFTLPCEVTAPPSPRVVGTTMTWGTVERLYGSWEALLAANPTWIDLLDTVGSPEDLVVI